MFKWFHHILKTQTRDFDVYSKNPRQSAIQTEQYLDKQFGHDAFVTKKGVSPNTYRVSSKATGKVYADYTKPNESTPNKKIGETRYTTLRFELKKAIRTLKQKKYAYRHQKERNKIKRITSALKHQINNPKNLKGIKMKWLWTEKSDDNIKNDDCSSPINLCSWMGYPNQGGNNFCW